MYYAFTIDTSLRRIQRDKQSWFYAPWYWENCEEINLRSSPYKLAKIWQKLIGYIIIDCST